MKAIKISLFMAFFLFSLIASFCYSAWDWISKQSQPTNSNIKCEINIEQGASLKLIAALLQGNKVIRNAFIFKSYVRLLAVDHLLKPGEYTFNGNETLSEVVFSLLKGNMKTVPVTIPEGTNLQQVASILQDAGICSAFEFTEAVSDPGLLGKVFSQWELIPLPEGLIFPDTYFFMKPSPASVVAERMLRLTKHQIDRIFGESLPNGLSQYEGCILASIIEEEAVLSSERPIIASVFYNRLKKNIKLESCATVLYALGYHKDRVLYEDLKVDSPYNTYMYQGLPPTPIANFGTASMKAVAEPASTDYLYFVAKGDGGHNFSKTISEHNHNKKIYFQRRKSRQ